MNNACILILIKIKQFSNIFIKYKSHRWAQEVRPIEQGQRSLPTACPLETSQSRAGGKRRTTGTGSGPVSPPPWTCLDSPCPKPARIPLSCPTDAEPKAWRAVPVRVFHHIPKQSLCSIWFFCNLCLVILIRSALIMKNGGVWN
jgi:hypothetical protein